MDLLSLSKQWSERTFFQNKKMTPGMPAELQTINTETAKA